MPDAPQPDPVPVRPYLRLWRDWLAPHWMLMTLAIAMTVVVAAANGAYAKLIQVVMTAFEAKEQGAVWWAPAAVLALTAVNSTAQYLRETTATRAVTRVETELRKKMFARLVGTDLARLQTEAPAGLAARFSSDISLVGGAVKAIMGGVTGILTIVFTFFVMLSIDWQLTLAIFGIFSLSLNDMKTAFVAAEAEPFKTTVALHFQREWPFVVFALALLAAGLFVRRFYCRYLCPLGAALAIPARLRMFEWLKRRPQCGRECRQCAVHCPVGAIYPSGAISPNECVYCLNCQSLYHDPNVCLGLKARAARQAARDQMAKGGANAG